MVTWEIWLWTIAWPAMRFGGFIDDYLKKLYHHRNVTLNNPHAS
uniref:Uncharacterized protein n=1 Tax=Brassica oleracea TaxID=3712 RepID=A0A3P6BJL0_BRAOL|nr:unnamed protein product [Brassica oleracea]